jgi:hypothetical protein
MGKDASLNVTLSLQRDLYPAFCRWPAVSKAAGSYIGGANAACFGY